MKFTAGDYLHRSYLVNAAIESIAPRNYRDDIPPAQQNRTKKCDRYLVVLQFITFVFFGAK